MISTVYDLCLYIKNNIRDNPCCIETGSAYCVDKDNIIHTTTNNIANVICLSKNGVLYSLDIDSEHQELAYSVCDKNALVTFILGDSVESLMGLGSRVKSIYGGVDVLWLDSKEFDVDHAVNEFNAIEPYLHTKHWVMVDDIHNVNSVKWCKIVPILKKLGYSYTEINTPTGLFVAQKGYSLPNV